MNLERMQTELENHIESEKEEIERCKHFLIAIEEAECPSELLIAAKFCIQVQENLKTRSEEVLSKILSESESESEKEETPE